MKTKLVLQNLGYDAKPYEDAILRALQQNLVVGSFNIAAITLRDARGDYMTQEAWTPGTKNLDDIARTVAAGILAAYKDHDERAFRTVEIEFK